MSNLDNLVEKILKDCEEKAKQVIEDAKSKAAETIKQSVSEAELEKERILAEAEREAERTAERLILSKKLEIRDNNLKAKQEVIDRIFAGALEKLNKMPRKEYIKFLKNCLLSEDIDGEEIILPPGYDIKLEEINDFLKKNNKNGNLKAYAGDKKIAGGFILVKDGIENNNTFEALVDFYRYETESMITAKIF